MSQDYREFFHDVHDAYPEPPKWIINDWTPVGLKIYGAPPKNFKSTIADSEPAIIAGWECNALPPWASLHRTKDHEMSGPTVILSGQATTGELNYLYNQCLGVKTRPDTIYINDDPWHFKLDSPKRMKSLMSLLEDIDARQVIVDPLQSYVSGNLDDARYVEDILYPWRSWAIKKDASFVVVHHLQKDPVGAEIDELLDPARLRGSGNIFGQADCVFMVRCINRFLGLVRIRAIFKRGQPWDRTMFIGAPGYGETWKVMGQEEITQVDMAVKALKDKGVLATQIAKQLHLKQMEVDDSISKLERNL